MREAVAQPDAVWRYIEDNSLLDHNPLYTVNIPATALGFRITKQGSTYFCDVFEEAEDTMDLQTGCHIDDVFSDDETLDTVMTEKGYVTLTPLLITRTNLAVLEEPKPLDM